MILVRNIRLPLSSPDPEQEAVRQAYRTLRLRGNAPAQAGVAKLSVDARHGTPVLVYTCLLYTSIRKLSIITNRRGFLKEKKVRFCLHDMVKYGKIFNVELSLIHIYADQHNGACPACGPGGRSRPDPDSADTG